MTNVAILGAGNIARQMAKTLRLMKARGDKVELYAVGSRDKARAEAFAQAEGFAKAYGSYEELLRDDGVDLVYIATPHSHHGEQIEQCVTHGKAVLCEKAFTATAAQAERALALAKEKGVLVTEAIWTRYVPMRRMLDELLASGAIGTAIFSFDVWDSNLPRIEIYGTKGTLCLPDIDPLDGPNIFGGDIWLRTEENYRWYSQPRDWFDVKKDWEHVPLTRPFASTSHSENSRGIGLIDMVLALAENRPERASGRMALHSLEMMEKMLSGAKTQQFGILETTFDRPQPLPADFPVR